jgi:CubicO group peptidase (beta-lactamase class C family)
MRGSPAGGGYSTALDELSFANALTKHQLLDKAHTEMLIANPIKTNWNDRYGFGFATSPENVEPRWFGHSGGAEGINSSLKIYPDSGYTVIVMSNLDKPAAERVADFIEERMPALK